VATSDPEHFKKIAESLRGILTQTNPVFSDFEKGEVLDFINSDEYGLAFETLCAIIKEERKKLSSETYERIDALGRSMSMHPKLWSDLRNT
jgi:hypothetical protein